ncbi:DUF3846 domain-containing protein [Micrococcus luteus]|nr:DUF3846 domain-containing protein [Micrococcus luteus]MCV7584352.1 DUF3846 domain-containing protein [Micrococcus luteus]MCV7589047.1 DUF3846 domain-containing protein [Micrococcus luteus]
MTKALLIPTLTTDPVTITEAEGLEALQKAVGGFVEPVPGEDFTAWVNEDGKVVGLPFNPRADRFLHLAIPDLPTWDCIVGPVIITGGADEDGEDTDITDELIAQVNKYLGLSL